MAERVLSKLGISVGDAINLFLGQICIQKGIPFALFIIRKIANLAART